jgi:hypothetical protein
MPHISLRVSEQEKIYMESYAKVHGITLSDALKDIFFQKLEDEYDMQVLREYEKEKASGVHEYFTHEEVGKKLGFR